jgi:hypothetical protein
MLCLLCLDRTLSTDCYRPGGVKQSGACAERAEACPQPRQDPYSVTPGRPNTLREHPGHTQGWSPNLVDLRDRTLIGTLFYSFARIGATLAMQVEDLFPSGKRWYLRLHEKGGKYHEMPVHHTPLNISTTRFIVKGE